MKVVYFTACSGASLLSSLRITNRHLAMRGRVIILYIFFFKNNDRGSLFYGVTNFREGSFYFAWGSHNIMTGES